MLCLPMLMLWMLFITETWSKLEDQKLLFDLWQFHNAMPNEPMTENRMRTAYGDLELPNVRDHHEVDPMI